MAIDNAINALIAQRRRINRALNHIHILQRRQIALHHIVHRMRKIHHDHMAGAIFSKPFGLRTTPPPRVHHQFTLKRVGAAKGVSHRVLEPVILEIGEAEIVPLIAKRLEAGGGHVAYKTGNAVDDGIARTGWRHQRTGFDSAIDIGDRIDQVQRLFSDGLAEIVEEIGSQEVIGLLNL